MRAFFMGRKKRKQNVTIICHVMITGIKSQDIRFRLDRSGGVEYEYDNMGNVSYEKRTVVVPQKGLATFETAWDYDSYGKLLRMTYPGDERVTYHYNAAGDLDRVYRGKENAGRDYVSYIGYDRFGDRVRVAYGNGTDMRYSYNAKTRRLTTATSRLNGTARASRNYLYDNVGNVFKISGASPVSYTYYYDYDDLYRLVSCTQRYGSGNAVATDTLAMAYDDLWRVTSKSQRLAQKGLMFPGTLNTGYDMDYSYGTAPGTHYQLRDVAETSYRTSATPTLADNILNTHSYSYDPNGNLACESVARKRIDNSTTNQISERKLLWDGENRLRALSENGYVSLYWYDTDGNRTVKEHLGGEAVWVNSAPAGQRTDTITYSIYPSPYISVTGDRWTKHYYIGGERIASRTGTLSGGFASLNIGDSNSAGNGLEITIDYGAMCSAEEDTIDSIYSHFGVPYEALHTNARDGGRHLYLPVSYDKEGGDSDNTADISDNRNTTENRNLPHLNGDSQVYFYHCDHLGSTMSVTDSLGATVQQVEYTPWGEVFVERSFVSSGYESPFLFNGKELDEETGLYYYGARYYDPKMSVWYSVDRFAEKYPFATPYNYSVYNPLAIIDEIGDSIKAVTNRSGLILQNEIHNTFYGSRFNKLNSLFQLSNDGRTMKGIKRKDFAAAIRNLNSDEKALAIGYYNAINSKEIHYVEFVRQIDNLNQMTKNAFYNETWQTGADVDVNTGGGINIKYNKGSFTIVVVNSVVNIDYVYAANGHHYSRFSTPAELLAHELIGHGYGRSVNSNTSRHLDAIQLTNLYWRVRGYKNFYRDGTNHGGRNYKKLTRSEATGIPSFLKHY